MPIVSTGPVCARRDCSLPEWKDRLCARSWRLADRFGKDPGLFAYEPLDGYADARDAVALPWEHLEREARGRGVAPADLIRAPAGRSAGRRLRRAALRRRPAPHR